MDIVQPFMWHGDGRELAVLNYILELPNLQGKPEAILSAIDQWSAKNQILMTVGPDRSSILLDLIVEKKPNVMVELGCYIGYSAIKFGNAVRSAGGKQYLSLESNPDYAAIACKMIDLAGLQDFVKIIVGPSSESLRGLVQQNTTLKIDMLFIDHSGRFYNSDLRLTEDLQLLGQNAVVVADNVSDPNAYEYVARMLGQSISSEPPNPSFEGKWFSDLEGVFETQVSYFKLQTDELDSMMVSRRI